MTPRRSKTSHFNQFEVLEPRRFLSANSPCDAEPVGEPWPSSFVERINLASDVIESAVQPFGNANRLEPLTMRTQASVVSEATSSYSAIDSSAIDSWFERGSNEFWVTSQELFFAVDSFRRFEEAIFRSALNSEPFAQRRQPTAVDQELNAIDSLAQLSQQDSGPTALSVGQFEPLSPNSLADSEFPTGSQTRSLSEESGQAEGLASRPNSTNGTSFENIAGVSAKAASTFSAIAALSVASDYSVAFAMSATQQATVNVTQVANVVYSLNDLDWNTAPVLTRSESTNLETRLAKNTFQSSEANLVAFTALSSLMPMDENTQPSSTNLACVESSQMEHSRHLSAVARLLSQLDENEKVDDERSFAQYLIARVGPALLIGATAGWYYAHSRSKANEQDNAERQSLPQRKQAFSTSRTKLV